MAIVPSHAYAVVLALLSMAAPTQSRSPGQPIEPGTSAIAGRVLDAKTAQPLERVLVRLFELNTGRVAEYRTTVDGTYAFGDIAQGEYSVTAISDSHGQSCYGATDLFRAQCMVIAVVRGQRLSGIDFQMPAGAAISGVVVDHNGRPVRGARVMTRFAPLPGNQFQTGGDGRFQLTNLMPGENQVVVEPASAPGEPEPPATLYPGERQFLPFESGQQITGVTIALPRVASSTLTTRVAAAADVDSIVMMVASVHPRTSRRLLLSPDGVATARWLRDGRYYVYARGQSPNATVASFQVVDLLDGDYDVSLKLQPTGRITGRITAERGGLPSLDGVTVEAVWTEDGATIDPLARDEAIPAADGRFRIDNLFGTRMLHVSGLSSGWRVVAVRVGSRDVAQTGVDIASGADADVTIVVGRE